MSRARPHVVFLAHQLERTGAALLLLHCVERIAIERDWQLTVIARRPGQLGPQFGSCARVVYLTPPLLAPLGGLAHRLGAGRAWRRAMLRCGFAGGLDPDLVYSNTITNDLEIRKLIPEGVPVITHAHELSAASAAMRSSDLDAVIAGTDRFVAVSTGVAAMLTSRGVQPADIVVVAPGIQSPGNGHGSARSEGSSSLGDTDTRYVVGGCGSARAEKGIDLFLDVADALLQTRDDVTLRWVGAGLDDLRRSGLARRARQLGSRVQFIGPVDDVAPFYRSLDVFALTSRLDPFPLVMIEAAANELPLLAFSGSGGADDFLADAGQELIDDWSPVAMADAISKLLDDADARNLLAHRASEFAARYTVDHVAHEMIDQIEGLLPRRSVRAKSLA